jgi:type IV pilus assembly protein PilC
MARYKYVGKNATGKAINGIVVAENEGAAQNKLRSQKIQVSSLSSAGGFDIKAFFAGFGEEKVTVGDVAIFSRQFSTMINAGLPVLQALNIISEQAQKNSLKKIVNGLKDDIGSGGNLSDSMQKYPKVFDELYVNMIRSGELGGVLDVILDRLSIYMEKNDALKRKIKSAMMYPSIVMSVAILVVVFLMVKVVPTFKEVFDSFGATLPGPTQLLVDVSNFFQKSWYIMLAVIIGTIFGLKFAAKTEKGAFALDGYMLKMPVFGDLVRKSAVARFARTLGTLLKSGVPILEALETVAKTSGNRVVEGVILTARASIREGQGLTDPLKKSGVFPPMVTQMVSVGEETGKIDEMLMRAADFYEDEVDTAVEGLSSIMEPIIIVFLGVTIGYIVVAMFMPMFDMGNVASNAH